MAEIDMEKLCETLEAVPRGCWISYLDAVTPAGGRQPQARALNMWLKRHGLPNAHRVLKSNGTVAATALDDPAYVRRMLESEGVEFTAAKADPTRRYRPPEVLEAELAERLEPVAEQVAV